MKFVKLFNLISIENSDQQYIYLEDFYSYLTNNQCNIRDIDKHIKRTLQLYEGIIENFDGKDIISVNSILRYCFHCYAKNIKCKELCSTVLNHLLATKHHSESSVLTCLELYKRIAQSSICDRISFLESVELDEYSIKTLIQEHRHNFDEKEWLCIVVFEYHFSRELGSRFETLTYDQILDLKFARFDKLTEFNHHVKRINQISNQELKKRELRIRKSEKLEDVHLFTKKIHNPLVIENEVLTIIKGNGIDCVDQVICYDIHGNRQKENCIEIVCVLDSDLNVNVQDICQAVFNTVKKTHNVNVPKIYFINNKSLANFKTEDGFLRYHIRDALDLSKIDEIVYQWKAECAQFTDIASDSVEHCTVCESTDLLQPLEVGNFQILNEWYFETPLEIQLFFSIFINRETIKRTKNVEQYYKDRLRSLYIIYDSLLNVLNKNYTGIFQSKSTSELLIEYKSVKSVFNVTSDLKSTCSLKTGEKKLKRLTNSDKCYYRTFLKPYELPYQTIHGDTSSCVSLYNCHIILMLDNLVRLTYVADPNPGENRSNQLCTLPITIQGLPVDHTLTTQWHLGECNGEESCRCKERERLTQADLERVLMELSPKERDIAQQFSKLMIWGQNHLWREIPDDVWAIMDNGVGTSMEGFEGNSLPEYGVSYDQIESQDQEEDEDLCDVMSKVFREENHDEIVSVIDSDDDNLSELESSMDILFLEDNEQSCFKSDTTNKSIDLLSSFGFNKYHVPQLLCRHPPPAVGRDDDISKIAEILDDVLTKMGYNSVPQKRANRILCGPDHKIGSSLIKLMETNEKYECFLPEFPLLHLRKSQITILFSAYKDAGIVELLQLMKEDDQTEWTKLVTIQHIDSATRYVKRLTMAFHVAFLVQFARSLSEDDMHSFLIDMEHDDAQMLSNKWHEKFELFMSTSSQKNGTFALHRDMMIHCDHIVAISLAERLGGPTGYGLLLSSIKRSLPFSFLNNATSYAPYCIKLLYHHYAAGHYHRCLKEALFTTPIKNSNRNFACDTKREMDHLDAMKGFRAGSNMSSLTSRMSLVDFFNDSDRRSNISQSDDSLGWSTSETDKKHVFPTVLVLLERNGISIEDNVTPMNVYSIIPTILPHEILDEASVDAGKYLMLRFCGREKLFQMDSTNIPDISAFGGTQALLQKAKRSKGVTIKRVMKSTVKAVQTESQRRENERQKTVAKESKLIDCFSSRNNACQALLHPDSSKPKVMKSFGIQKAFRELLQPLIVRENEREFADYMNINAPSMPMNILANMKVCLVEFAGFKFKLGNIQTGREYLQCIEYFLNRTVKDSKNLSRIVVCEEKYSFTPDDFKASTRLQRKVSNVSNVHHLKSDATTLSLSTFHKQVLLKTETGKQRLSQFLGQNLKYVSLERDVELIVDSDSYVTTQYESCNSFAIPVGTKYSGCEKREYQLPDIRQRKGEAEMAVIDWLISQRDGIKDGESVVSFITSGDIDAVYIHLYAVSKQWPRREDGNFVAPVYVVLQKPHNKYDIYNITLILELLERVYSDKEIGMKFAVVLCMGGNDFIPKFHQIPHSMFLKTFAENSTIRNTIFTNENEILNLDTTVFLEFIMNLFCPKKFKNRKLSFEQIRAITIGKRGDNTKRQCWKTNDPRKWLPPKTCMEHLADLVSYQIKYLNTAGIHAAEMPNFLNCKCLKKNLSGDVEYDFGPDSYFESVGDLPIYEEKRGPVKRQLQYTPQRGTRMKRPVTSTPHSEQNT